MAEGVDDSVDLGLRDAELLREISGELVDELVALRLEIVAHLLQGGLELGLADAEVLGERVELLVADPAVPRRAAEPGPDVLQRGAQLGLGGPGGLGGGGGGGGAGRGRMSCSAERSLASVTPSDLARSARSCGRPPLWTSSIAERTLAAE